MATPQVETVSTGADKAKLAVAVALVLAAVLTIWSMVYYLRKAVPEIRAKAQ